MAFSIDFQAQAQEVFGKMGYTNPLFILAVYAPALAGVFLVWRHDDLAGRGSFAQRLTLWRIAWPWWALLVVGIPATFYADATLMGTLDGPFPFSPWTAVLPALLTTLLIGPIEEFGWRGVALPLILTRMFNAARGSLLVAALFHFQVNGPAWPDAQPWDSVIFAVLAAAIVAFNREHYFDKTAGAVEILAPASSLHGSPVKLA